MWVLFLFCVCMSSSFSPLIASEEVREENPRRLCYGSLVELHMYTEDSESDSDGEFSSFFLGTGTLVGPDKILTAAHNVVRKSGERYARIIGRMYIKNSNGKRTVRKRLIDPEGSMLFSENYSREDGFCFYEAFCESKMLRMSLQIKNDLALLTLKKPFGRSGFPYRKGPFLVERSPEKGQNPLSVCVSGFRLDEGNGDIIFDSDEGEAFLICDVFVYEKGLQTFGGMSGGPINLPGTGFAGVHHGKVLFKEDIFLSSYQGNRGAGPSFIGKSYFIPSPGFSLSIIH